MQGIPLFLLFFSHLYHYKCIFKKFTPNQQHWKKETNPKISVTVCAHSQPQSVCAKPVAAFYFPGRGSDF